MYIQPEKLFASVSSVIHKVPTFKKKKKAARHIKRKNKGKHFQETNKKKINRTTQYDMNVGTIKQDILKN